MDMMNLVKRGAGLLGLNQEKTAEAAQKALPYLKTVRTKSDALQALAEIGMPNDFLDRAIGMLDTPKGKTVAGIASLAGIDVAEAKRSVQSLKSNERHTKMTTEERQTEKQTKTNDPLEALKSDLSRFQR